MIEQNARVVDICGNQLELEAESSSTCGTCGVRSGCGTSVLAKWVGKKFVRFRALNTVNAKIGDQVVVGLSENALITGSLSIYLWPILGMMFFALASDWLLSPNDQHRDLIIALFGGLGFFIAIRVSRLFLARGSLIKELSPVVLRKIIGHDRI